MATERKIKLTLDGEKEFKNALSSINTQTKALNSEMKAVTSSFDKNTTAEEKNRRTKELLEKTTESYNKKLEVLKERIELGTKELGKNSDYVNDLKKKYFDTEAELNKFTASIKQMGEASEESGSKALSFSDVLGANLLSGLIQKGLETLASKMLDIRKAAVELGFARRSMADELNTMAKVTSLSTETIQEFKYASTFIDVELETMTGSLTKLTKQMYSASTGSKSSAEAFKTLGINIYNADGSLRDSYDVFLEVIDALGRIDDEATRDGLAMSVFGKSAQQLNPLIRAGSGVLDDYRQKAHEVGYVLDQETLDALSGVNDEVDAMKLQFERLKNQLGAEVSPVISEVIVALKDFVRAVDWEAVGTVIYTALMTIRGAFMRAYYIVKSVIDSLIWLGGVFEELPSKVEARREGIATKFEEIKTAIKTKFEELIESAKNWGKDMIDGFINGIKSKIDAVKSAVSGIASTVRGYLHFSRPDVGPLRDYEKWMPDMVEGLRRTLSASSYKLENAVGGLANGMAGGLNGGGVVISGITINGVRDESQIDRMVNQIEKKLGQRLYR